MPLYLLVQVCVLSSQNSNYVKVHYNNYFSSSLVSLVCAHIADSITKLTYFQIQREELMTTTTHDKPSHVPVKRPIERLENTYTSGNANKRKHLKEAQEHSRAE